MKSLILIVACFAPVVSATAAQGAFLGVQLEQGAAQGGARVQDVIPSSTAEIMGLQPGDLILAVDGADVADFAALAGKIAAKSPGDLLTVRVHRGDQEMDLRGILGRRPAALEPPFPALPGAPSGELDVPELEELPEQHVDALERLWENVPAPGEWREFFLREAPHDMWWDIPSRRLRAWEQPFRFHWLPHDFDFSAPGTSRVYLRYPAATPVEERERILDEAQEKYGPDVQVEFRGEGMEMRFEYSSRAQETLPPAGEGGDRKLDVEEKDRSMAPDRSSENWHQSLEEAMESAEKSGKLVLLDFAADWCEPCRQLDQQVLGNAKHHELMSRFELVRVDIDDQPKVAEKFQVRGIPDLRILTPQGVEIERAVGFRGEKSTVQMLDDASAKAEKGPPPSSDFKADLERQREELQKALQEVRQELEALRKELASTSGGED